MYLLFNALFILLLATLVSMVLCLVLRVRELPAYVGANKAVRYAVTVFFVAALLILIAARDIRFEPHPIVVVFAGFLLLLGGHFLLAARQSERWYKSLPEHIHAIAAYRMTVVRNLEIAIAICIQAGLLLLPQTWALVARWPLTLIVPALMIIINFTMGWGVIRTYWRKRPHHNLLVKFEQTASVECETPIDWFISYRSCDSDRVRPIVDALLAAGKTVWFAEYAIGFFARDQFQAAIDHGIARSRGALLFTSESYFDSEHCLIEVRAISDRLSKFDMQVIEVPIAASAAHTTTCSEPQLLGSDGECVNHVRRKATVSSTKDVCKDLGLEVTDRLTSSEPRSFTLTINGGQVGVTCAARAWNIREGGETQNSPGRMIANEAHQVQLTGRRDFSSCCIDVEMSIRPHRDLIAETTENSFTAIPNGSEFVLSLHRFDENSEDRELNAMLRNFEMLRTADSGEACVGYHLLHWNGRGQSLLTLWDGDRWRRRFTLLLLNELPDDSIQLEVDFRSSGSFRQFAEAFEEMALFVDSLNVTRQTPPERPDATAVAPASADDPRLEPLQAQVFAAIRHVPFTSRSNELHSAAFHLVEFSSRTPHLQASANLLALRWEEEAVNLAPANYRAWNELSFILSRLRRFREALDAIEKAIENVKMEPRPLFLDDRASELSKYQRARVAVSISAIVNEGQTAESDELITTLRHEIKRLIEENPDDPANYLYLADISAVSGEPQSKWEGYLSTAANRYRHRTKNASGQPLDAARVRSTLLENTLRCTLLSRREFWAV